MLRCLLFAKKMFCYLIADKYAGTIAKRISVSKSFPFRLTPPLGLLCLNSIRSPGDENERNCKVQQTSS